jgi:hypothetical protein
MTEVPQAIIDATAERLNELWPHVLNDGFQDEVARAAAAVITEGIPGRRCLACGSVYPVGSLHHCMPGEPGDPPDE